MFKNMVLWLKWKLDPRTNGTTFEDYKAGKVEEAKDSALKAEQAAKNKASQQKNRELRHKKQADRVAVNKAEKSYQSKIRTANKKYSNKLKILNGSNKQGFWQSESSFIKQQEERQKVKLSIEQDKIVLDNTLKKAETELKNKLAAINGKPNLNYDKPASEAKSTVAVTTSAANTTNNNPTQVVPQAVSELDVTS